MAAIKRAEENNQLATIFLDKDAPERLQLMVEGLTNQAIAKMLGVSIYTVKGYIHNIFQKLNVNDRTRQDAKKPRRKG